MKRLADDGYVNYAWRRTITLTDEGKQIACLLLRKHRLLELFLHRILKYPLPDLHAEAGRIEHILTAEFMARIDTLLNHPQLDPHGHPIPNPDGILPAITLISLRNVPLMTPCRIVQVPDDDSALLAYLCEQGVVPGTPLKIIARSDVDGVLTLQLETDVLAVSYALADMIGVELVAP